MEQPFSTSKVTGKQLHALLVRAPFADTYVPAPVEYFDPHDVYKLLAPGLIPRLPLRNLHWQSHAGPLRSIESLHVELVDALAAAKAPKPPPSRGSNITPGGGDDGFTTQSLGTHRPASSDGLDLPHVFPAKPFSPGYGPSAAGARRHQIPGLRRTPYLKVLLVRCDDNDSYKASVRSEIREWVKENTPPAQASSSKKDQKNAAENHDAFEWLIVHVVVPNTVAATQPRMTGSGSAVKGTEASSDSLVPAAKTAASRWRGTSSTLMEKLRSDFNGSSKHPVDRIAQIRIGINDVPYDILPRVVPAVPSGYMETEADAEAAWADIISKFRGLILSSFDMRVTQYEDDIREKDAQRKLPGWNFCTFFILKEGLAGGFESVGLVEDALVGYDELSVGLDTIIQEQALAGSDGAHGGALLAYTDDLKRVAQKALAAVSTGTMEFEDGDDETVDLQSKDQPEATEKFDEIPISLVKKPYRDLILANNVSIFDFRCYIFARQVALLLRLGNAWSTKGELVTKLREQQDSVLHGVAPRAPPPKQTDETENLAMLAEICKRTLEFIPSVSQIMRRDIIAALTEQMKLESGENRVTASAATILSEVSENVVASFAFAVAQQILAQTSTKALPIPPSSITPQTGSDHRPKSALLPEPKTLMHPARTTSLKVGTGAGSDARASSSRPPPSPNVFPGPGSRRASVPEADAVQQQFLKVGLEDLAARRAELYALSRNILEECGKKRGWSDGWSSVPVVGDTGVEDMQDISLDDDAATLVGDAAKTPSRASGTQHTMAGLDNQLLRTALDNREDFYRLYETLTDKALRHYTVAGYTYSVQASMADLAVLKYYVEDYAAAAGYFYLTTPFYGESGWSLLELSMLVMYSKCLRELQRKDEYVRVVLKLLSKAAVAEKERREQKTSLKLGAAEAKKEYPEMQAIKGFLPDFLATAKSYNNEAKASLQNFFTDIELEGTPIYVEGQDSFALTLNLRSVLADTLPVDKATMRLVSPGPGGKKEILLENNEAVDLKPGKNKITLRSNAMSPGTYEVDQILLWSGQLKLHFEREASQPVDKAAVNLKNPYVALYQRADSLDLRLDPSAVMQLDQNNGMDIELSTGWNEVKTCEIRIRSATGGLRLLTAEAELLGDEKRSLKSPEAGLFSFSDLAARSSARIRFPYTTEHDVLRVAVKVEVKYTTEKGTFTLSKTPSIPLALRLGVNVQDVFKQAALFSRFTVSTATPSPLRLFNSELVESEVFESKFGIPLQKPVVIFPKQPASLLYKITRKADSKIGPKTKKTMYLKLDYSVLQDEIEDIVRNSLTAALKDTPLWQYSRMVTASLLHHIRNELTVYDLERSAMLGFLPTSFLADVKWQKQFFGLGYAVDGTDAAQQLAEFIFQWTRDNARMPVFQTKPPNPQTIFIPVDIPSVTVVHTADIRLQRPIPSLLSDDQVENGGTALACVNQMLPATLHLKWTRIWDTDHLDAAKVAANDYAEEFSYEVTAPGDTWLLGGRRKGHFVIPAPTATSSVEQLSSSPINEADIPLLLIPLREGWLPYPSVELREVRASENVYGLDGAEGLGIQNLAHCETDYRNLGETVRVVADRKRVTVSLDASGAGGGPLVLESERVMGMAERIVV